MNCFLKINDSLLENSLVRFIQYCLNIPVKLISPGDYEEGIIIVLAHDFKNIKGELHFVKDGIRILHIINPERAMVFYIFMRNKNYNYSNLIDIKDVKNLRENIAKAFDGKTNFKYRSILEQIEDSYKITHH